MKNVTDYTLPEYLAPYLINDDPTGLTDKEIEEVDKWYNEVRPGVCVGCSDVAEFSHRNDLNNIGGNVLTYQFIQY